MQSSCKTEFEYWDDIGKARVESSDVGARVISDNCDKKRAVLAELLQRDYCFKNVFEIGTGLGNIALAVSSLYMGSMKYAGCDISDSFIEISRSLGLNVLKTKSIDLKVADQCADFVWAFDVLEHINPDEREQTYREIKRILKPDGIICINSPLMHSFHEQYDYGFSEHDAQKLMEIVGAKRVKRKVISYNELDDSMRAYMYEEFQRS